MLKRSFAGIMTLVLCVAIAPFAHAEDRNAAVQDALKASGAWLKLIDDGKYRESWSEAASFFRDKITAERWTSMVGGVRQPLGAMQSRKFKLAQYATELPGAPAGEYVVIQYDTSYANKPSAHRGDGFHRRPLARLGLLHQVRWRAGTPSKDPAQCPGRSHSPPSVAR